MVSRGGLLATELLYYPTIEAALKVEQDGSLVWHAGHCSPNCLAAAKSERLSPAALLKSLELSRHMPRGA